MSLDENLGPDCRDQMLLRDPLLRVEPGVCVNVCRESLLTDEQLGSIFAEVCALSDYRKFGGRYIWDEKLDGALEAKLQPPRDFLNPLLEVLAAIAQRTLEDGQELAVIQMFVNCLRSRSNGVKPHRHCCRQVCVSLGEACTVEVEGREIRMQHGDCIHLNRELHSVPQDKTRLRPRVSVCLFYASTEEYANGTAGVASDGGLYFVHPEDKPPHLSLVEEAQLGEHTGRIKYVSDVFQYGIIECGALQDRGFADVFVKKKKLTGLAPGTEVTFSAFVNSKGQPQVKEVLRCIAAGETCN